MGLMADRRVGLSRIRMGRCRTCTATSRVAPRQFVDQASIRAVFDSSIVRRESCATVEAHTAGVLHWLNEQIVYALTRPI